jgi:hypothetical protein
VNRGRLADADAYQRLYSGTYGTMDEFTIYDFSPDPQTPAGFDWPYRLRSAGRYYCWKPKAGEERPWFVSQSLFDSERAQSYAFATEEEETEVLIELGTVRWTVFTPYHCVDIPSERLGQEGEADNWDERTSQWQFNAHEYFADVTGDDKAGEADRPYVTQMWRHRPEHWTLDGKRSRNSSQRGCRVQIVVGADVKGSGGLAYPHGNVFYDDPEAWEPILDTRSDDAYEGRHLKAVPGDVRYKVTFELSDRENAALIRNRDACLIDSPVFDDITITYLRRPKVLEWRE